MSLLCTFPGKFGDLLWALPTIRAISRRIGEPVDLAVAWPLRSICQLISSQPYIGECTALNDWKTEDTAPISPRVPPLEWWPTLSGGKVTTYTVMLNLGYRSWPTPDLVRHTLETANLEASAYPWLPGTDATYLGLRWSPLTVEDLALEEPWITLTGPPPGPEIAVAFTDEYFELKFGVTLLALEHFFRRGLHAINYRILYTAGSRWDTEPWRLAKGGARAWDGYARTIAQAGVLLADCSAAHVLGVAMGVPVVLMEPQPLRHNDTFYPLGKIGPQVTLVTGNDGLPTWDARHVADALTTMLARKESLDAHR